jgi:MYXO-CTERM domain-containing protein
MERAARNRLFEAGPDYGTIGQGCEGSVSVPASFPCVLVKAIAYAESTWRQFCSSACGETGPTVISFDCGYGLTQVTSGMSGGAGFDPTRVAREPAYNLGAGMRILASKWRATPCIGDNQPLVLEHWYFATWAYNSFSWRNNPNNPDYPANRPPFNGPGTLSRGSYPYQEIIWGYMRNPPSSSGVRLWEPTAASYPDPAEICTTVDCRPTVALTEPQPVHRDSCQTTYVDTAELVLEAPANPLPATAGQTVSKRWVLKNTGERTWSTSDGYAFVRVSPEALGAPARVELAASCQHGATAELALQLTARPAGSASVTYELRRGSVAVGPQLVAVVTVPSPGDSDGDGVPAGTDCDDADPLVHPGAAERCDGKDQDCDRLVDEELRRTCRTGCGEGEERCADGTWSGCTAPTPAAESCDGTDEDCDGETDEDAPCPAGQVCWEGACAEDPVVVTPAAAASLEATGSCSCAGAGGPSPLSLLLALPALAALRPKRRRRS